MFNHTDTSTQSLHGLFVKEIQDLYSAEKQIVEALPKLIEAAADADLKKAFEDHLTQTEEHVERLENISEELSISLEGEECKGMKGVLEEGEEMSMEIEDQNVKDAAIIGAAQRVEHYEIAGYGTALAHAKLMHHDDVAKLLKKTLQEEGKADKLLSKLAQKDINKKALEA